MGRPNIFTEKQDRIIIENYYNLTSREIANLIDGNFTAKQIRGRVVALKKSSMMNIDGKRRKINNRYFQYIDTSLKAYYLGFIFADGWVVCNEKNGTYEFGMQLQSKDKYILEKLNEELGGQNAIYHTDPYISYIKGIKANHSHSDTLRVYSKKLIKDLIHQGVVTNKSKKEVYPIVDDDFFFDFLRGYIDGDGCYYTNKNSNTYMHITCGHIAPLYYIQCKLNKYNISTSVYSEYENKHRLTCTNNESMNILISKLYYSNSVFCLKRKYEKIKHFLGFAT